MISKIVFAAAVVVSLTSGQVFAESEGNGNPFPTPSVGQVTHGAALLSDTGSAAYPVLTGTAVAPSSLALLQPGWSNEAVIQTATSQPRGFTADPVAYARAHGLSHRMAGAPHEAG